MLAHLSIKNYALIDDLTVAFGPGFTTITGETGAGKSILLGGLSLVLGKRADMSSLRDRERKCSIEAEFDIENYDLASFFKDNDLDYDAHTIIRREIHPGGKSRAFVNDSPVTLDVLSQLGGRLIDVHSQHETLQLTENEFQMRVVDALASTSAIRLSFQEHLEVYHKTNQELETLKIQQIDSLKEQDYNTYLWNELAAFPLKNGMEEDLEEQFEQLNNVEQILDQLSKADQVMNDEQGGLLQLLAEMKQGFGKIAPFGSTYSTWHQRIQAVWIELEDMASELHKIKDTVEPDPVALEMANQKLQSLHDLKKKHGAVNVQDLLHIKAALSEKINRTENLAQEIKSKEVALKTQEGLLLKMAAELTRKRKAVLPDLKASLESDLVALGMPNASFRIEIRDAGRFNANGSDELLFLFSANKGTQFGELKKVASGGELSRIMLAIKSLLAQFEHLPTMMLDEIDSGVSGEISNRMADIMIAMSRNIQVFAITHLPQVASKGTYHFKVYKEDDNKRTHTKMKLLNPDERVVELAGMLGGKSLSDAAMAHARELLD